MIRLAVIALCACGRVGFDPLGSGDLSDAPAGDALGDGSALADAAPPDAAMTACASATLVGFGRSAVLDTCGRGNRVDGCAAADVEELVVKFIAPANLGYSFAAKDPGTDNVSNSISRLDSTCTSTASCAGILSFAMTAGESVFLVVEAATGTCASVEIDIQ